MDLDNELDDAQFFTREEVAALISTPKGSHLTPAENRSLEENAKANSDRETANALAPSERKPEEVQKGDGKGLTRVPPDTAIAGQLIRLWVKGGIDLVSKL